MTGRAIGIGAVLVGLLWSLSAPAEEITTPSELNESASRYDNQTVLVRGYLVLGPESRVMVESKELHEEIQRRFHEPSFDPRTVFKYCLTLIGRGSVIINDNRDEFNHQTLVLKGRFVANYLNGKIVDLQACALPTAIDLDQSDVEEKLQLIRSSTGGAR